MNSLKYLACLCLALLIACGGEPRKNSQGQKDKYRPENIVDGGTLVVGIPGGPDALNPLTALSKPAKDIISLLFRKLGEMNNDLESFSPQLAKSWSFSKDSLSITFNLQSNVTWHDGTPFTSEDVVFTYNMQIDPQVAWVNISFKERISTVKAVNDSTVVFEFRDKNPTMLRDAIEGYIVPEHLLAGISPDRIAEAEFNRNPIGTGPFKFVQWKTQQSIELEKFTDYYVEGKPHLNKVIFQFVPNSISLWQQVQSGDVGFMEGVPPRDFARLKEEWTEGETNIRPITFLGRMYDFIGWNLIDPENYAKVMAEYDDNAGKIDLDKLLKPNKLFGSQKVRAALTMAIDRSTISDVVNQKMAIKMDGPIPMIWSAYNSEANTVWNFNPSLALQYLKDEGWTDSDGDGILDKDGLKFSFEMATNSGNVRREQALTIIQEQLSKIGVEMIPRVVDPGLLFGRMLIPRDFDAALIGWEVGLKMDLYPLFHSKSLLMPFNFTSYTSHEFDKLEENIKGSFNRTDVQKYWDEIAKLLSDELPYTWLYYKMETVALHKRFKGTVIDKRGSYTNLQDWWIPLEERLEIDVNRTG